ncbi:MAG: methyltransferase domain-containing protein [bacterium]
MKLFHDIENDLEHTIPPAGGLDSQWLFRAMTERSIALLEAGGGARVLDLACGMGQDTLAVAERLAAPRGAADGGGAGGYALGLEPSQRMIRFAQTLWRGRATPAGGEAGFCRGLAEELPFRAASFDAVLCKGALDHFMEPRSTIGEIGRVLRPGGLAVIALANYDSLSCRLGQKLERAKALLAADYAPPRHPYFQPPPDHMTRFGHAAIRALARPPLRTTRVEGISLLWGFPPWSRLIAALPGPPRRVLLGGAFALAGVLPALADVVVLQAVRD